MIASIASATLLGVRGRPVLVEVVGLPDAACREARGRGRAALLSSGLPWPLRRVTVNVEEGQTRCHRFEDVTDARSRRPEEGA
jgi:magnesium chelatase family protein